MFKKMNFKMRMLVFFLIVGIIPLSIVGIVAQGIVKEIIKDGIYNHLISVRENKKYQIEQFFSERFDDVRVLADNPFVHEAFKTLNAAYDASRSSVGAKFKGYGNEKYDAPASYRILHDKYFPFFKYYLEQYDYNDIFLMCPDHADIIFTVAKSPDFGKRAIQEIQAQGKDLLGVWKISSREGKAALSDMHPYAPSGGRPAQFITAPIKEKGEIIGVIAIQISNDTINAVMTERSGMGETGETYLVGSDKLMRSDSYLDSQNHSVVSSFKNPSLGNVNTEAAKAALAGKKGLKVVINYKGNQVLSAYTPVDIGGIKWALISEIDVAEAFAGISKMNWLMIIVTCISIVTIILIAFFLSNYMRKPLIQVTAKLKTASEKLKTAAQQQLSSSTEQATAVTQLSTTMEEMSSSFKQIRDATAGTVSSVETTSALSDAGKASLDKSVDGMDRIKKQVENVVQNMLALNDKTQQMSTALEIIGELADQTTILSYNATIEAVAAGEEGRRFSALAEQIMKLANKAVESTKDVSRLIDDIQKSASKTVLVTEDSMKAVSEGFSHIKETRENFNKIIVSAESNTTSAKEIEMTISQQAYAVEQATEGIKNVEVAAEQIKASSKQTLDTADQMTEVTKKLA